MDICDLILEDHHRFRRTFALLDDVPRDDKESLSALWGRLKIELDVHAEAEERFFYPHLLDVGTGATDADDAEEETEDAIVDHNDIRDAAEEVDTHQVGSGPWWDAVGEVREHNSDHLGEEERQALADFRHNSDVETRHELGVQFAAFSAAHASEGVEAVDKDADEYIEEHS
jgi:Hemerythrin HHE cation binding domain